MMPISRIGKRYLALSLVFLTAGASLSFAGTTDFRYFRFTPTKLRNGGSANSVQLSEMQMFLGASQLTGASASNPGGNNPGGETPAKAVDGSVDTKWLDFNKGALVLDFGSTVTIDGYRWATANDAPERDPQTYTIYGTNDAISSVDNSDGSAESWTLIQNGSLNLPGGRNTAGSTIPVTNGTAYTSYRVVFDSLKNDVTANSMQIADIQFDGLVVPEPSSALLALLGLAPLLLRRRSR